MRKMIGVLIVAAVIAFLPDTALATLVTIDFEDLVIPPNDQVALPPGVSQDSGGFTFTPGPNDDSLLNDLHFHNEDGFGLNGSQNLGTHDDVVMTRVGNGTFSLLGFEFQGNITEAEQVLVYGVRQGGFAFTAAFLTDVAPSPVGIVVAYDLFNASDALPPTIFTDLISLTWEVSPGDTNGFNGFFLDNIRVEIDANGQVPEPAGFTLLLAGLAALYRRRRG